MATKPIELDPEIANTQLEILLWGLEASEKLGLEAREEQVAMHRAQFSHLKAYLRATKRLARLHKGQVQDIWWQELGGEEKCELETR